LGQRFEGFAEHELETVRGVTFARVGGSGPPLLLLHGYPQTHLMWHAAAPALADRFTVVAADLAGYGASFRPAPAPDHAPHSKRALAADQVQAMAALGHERFAVAGHDRGGRVAYRMTLDHPDRVSAAAVLDVVPTGEVWSRADARLALLYWHWSFLAQPAPLPERLIAADPDAFFDLHVRALGLGGEPDRSPRISWPPTGACSTTRAPWRRSARTTEPARASTATMTTPTSARDASSARCSPSGAHAAPFRGSTVTCWSSGAPGVLGGRRTRARTGALPVRPDRPPRRPYPAKHVRLRRSGRPFGVRECRAEFLTELRHALVGVAADSDQGS
jgi:pimeloyl-ACP methyl ester carboxylesterase